MHRVSAEAFRTDPGHGSEFVVRLSVIDEQARRMEHARLGESFMSAANARRIMVVDDNTDGAESMSLLLSSLGHDVRTAVDGLQALETADVFQPEVVLLDIGMPHMDGYETARRLRENAALRNALLIALTGWGQEDARRRSVEAGFDHHLVKPVDLDVLEKLILERRAPA